MPCPDTAAPTIDGGQTADLCDDATSITFTGTNFVSPATDNTVVLKDSANVTVAHGTVSGTSTYLTMTLTAPPIANLGALTAEVTTANGDSGAVQVATVKTCSTIWNDTFTDADGTTLETHTPNTSPGGSGYTESLGTITIQSNKAVNTTGVASTVRYTFDPGVTTSTTTVEFTATVAASMDTFALSPRYNNASQTGISRSSGSTFALVINGTTQTETVTLSDGVMNTMTIEDFGTSIRLTVNGVSATHAVTSGTTLFQLLITSTDGNVAVDNLTVES